jgi:hypothetical protein
MRVERRSTTRLVPDLPAIVIELLIQRTLIRLRQMTIIGAAHIMFLLVDGLDIAAVLTGLGPGDLSITTFGIDASFLVVLTTIDLVYSGMMLQVRRLMTGTLLSKRCCSNKQGNRSSNKRFHDCRILSCK